MTATNQPDSQAGDELHTRLEEIAQSYSGYIGVDNKEMWIAMFEQIEKDADRLAVKRAIDENIYHKLNSDAVFHGISKPTDEQRRIHEALMGKFDLRIKELSATFTKERKI